MAKLPPPPVVGRGQPRDAAARESADAIAEAAARLPSSVTDLPDEWLLGAAPAPAIPIPSPMSTSTPTADAPREADLFALPDFGEAPADPLAISVAPTDSRPDPLSDSVADPLVPVVEAEPIEEADVELEAAVIPAPRISAATEVAIESPAVVHDAPPPLVVPPRAAMKQQRRNALIGAGVIGAVLLTMVIARCSGDGPTSTTGDGIAIAPARAAGADGASKAGGAASAGGANEAAGGEAAGGADGGSTRGSADGAAAGGSAAGDAADDDDANAAGGDAAAASGGGDKAADSAAAGGADEKAAGADAAGAGTPPTDDSAAAANADAAAAGSDDAAVDNAAPASSSSSSSSSSKKPTPRTDSAATSGTQNTADAGMTAEESLAKARAAWKAGNAKETYKYANKSRFKEPSAEATELATLAACKMKLDDAAKTSYKQLEGDRKRKTRLACRDMGVRVGL